MLSYWSRGWNPAIYSYWNAWSKTNGIFQYCGCVRNVEEKASSRHWSLRMMNLWTRLKKYNFQTSPWNMWQHKNARRAGFVKNKFIFLWWGMDRLYSPLFQRRLWMQGRHNREYQNSWLRRNICKGSNFLYEFNKNNKYYITLFFNWFSCNNHSVGKN